MGRGSSKVGSGTEKTFADKALASHTYEGDGSEQVDFLQGQAIITS